MSDLENRLIVLDADREKTEREALKAHRKAQRKEFMDAPLSRVIEMALEDLAAVEKSDRYTVDMRTWHNPEPELYLDRSASGTCAVCFAGSVMANRLGAKINRLLDPGDFRSIQIEARLNALNLARCGDIESAFEHIDSRYDSRYEARCYAIDISKDEAARFDRYKLATDECSNVSFCPYEQNETEFKAAMRQYVKILRKHDL